MNGGPGSQRPEPIPYPFQENEGLGLSDAYMKLLEERKMTRVQLPFGEPAWLVTRFDDARFVLSDRRFSRTMATRRDEPRMTPRRVPESILTMDPPEHARVRKLVSKAFTVRRVEAMRPWIGELATKLVADMRSAGPPAELVSSYALPFPVTVICELLGVPEADRPQLRAWCDAALSTNGLTDEECMRSFMDMNRYFSNLVNERRAAPRDDLTSDLIEARDAYDQLTEQELIALCIAILIGGFETTASQLPNFIYLLQERRDRWTRLCTEPALIPSAVEEMLRYVPFAPNGTSARYALEDLDIGGVRVRAGEPLIVDTTAANRDRHIFENADDVILDREDNRHLVFGHGPHRCLGAHLARVEIQEGLKAIMAELPDLRIGGKVEWKLQMVIHAPCVLHVEW